MKSKFVLGAFLIMLMPSLTAQDVILTGKVKASVDVRRVVLDGASIELKDVTIACDVLQIQNVASLQINGKVKIKCRKFLQLDSARPSITLPASSSGMLVIEKPASLPNILFRNLSGDVEIKSVPLAE